MLAGLVGELVFEIYAWFISPAIFGISLEPANLVSALSAKMFGLPLLYAGAFTLHFLIGSIGFSLLVFLMQRLIKSNFVVSGAVTGVLLWFVAQGMLAPFIGRSFMMDFGAYTQSSFIGHVGMTLLIGVVLELRAGRRVQAGQTSTTS